MTGAEALTYVKKVLKRDDKDSEVYEAMTDVIMDMRLRFLSEDHKEEAYADIDTVGDYKLCLPSDVGHLIGSISIWDTSSDVDYRPLQKVSKERYDALYPERVLSNVSNRLTGIPEHFCVYGGEVFVGPAVDKDTYRFQLNYTTEDLGDSDITSSTDPVPFASKYRKTLRYGVLAQVYEGMEWFQEAEVWQAKFERDLAKIVENDEYNIEASSNIQYNGV